MDTLEEIRKKIQIAHELHAVVHPMKAIAASNIRQFETALKVSEDYYSNIETALVGYFHQQKTTKTTVDRISAKNESAIAIVFGSDQGLVGQFNGRLSDFIRQDLFEEKEQVEVWTVGEFIYNSLQNLAVVPSKLFHLPGSLDSVSELVSKLIIEVQHKNETEEINTVYLVHNKQIRGMNYGPVIKKLLPIDEDWVNQLKVKEWTTKQKPEVLGDKEDVLFNLVSEYLFVSIFQACVDSLVSENVSRLSAMQRAERNIDEILEKLNSSYHQTRQMMIDEELFDVLAGFEAIKNKKRPPVG